MSALESSLWMKDGWDNTEQRSCFSFSVLQAQICGLWCSPACLWPVIHQSNWQLSTDVGGWGRRYPGNHLYGFQVWQWSFSFLDVWETPCGMWVLIFIAFNCLDSRKDNHFVPVQNAATDCASVCLKQMQLYLDSTDSSALWISGASMKENLDILNTATSGA